MKWHWFPVACIWNEWGSWELCTTTCGTGSMTRSRSKYGPFYGGADCSGSATSSLTCNTNPCPGMRILESIRINKWIGSQCIAPGTTGNLGFVQLLLACPPWLDQEPRMIRYTVVQIARGLHHLQITAVNYDLNIRRREVVWWSRYSFPFSAFWLSDGNCACNNYLTSVSACEGAARTIGLSDTSAINDGENWASDPPYCYFEGGALKFNPGVNTGGCGGNDLCLCK